MIKFGKIFGKIFFKDGHSEDIIDAFPCFNAINFISNSGHYLYNYKDRLDTKFYKYHPELLNITFSADSVDICDASDCVLVEDSVYKVEINFGQFINDEKPQNSEAQNIINCIKDGKLPPLTKVHKDEKIFGLDVLK